MGKSRHHIISFLFGLILGGTAIHSDARASAEFAVPQSPDWIFLSLSQNAPLDGPVLQRDNGAAYVDEIVRLIIQEADRQARHFLKEQNPQAYWASLVGAIAVPYHETRFQHFRSLSKLSGRCITNLNSGVVLRADPTTYRMFTKVMKAGANPVVPLCTVFDRSGSARQLVGSEDHLSTGMMQFTMRGHPEYFTSGNYLSVEKTVQDGIDLYLDGLSALLRSANRYSCLIQHVNGHDVLDYQNLIRGAWSGNYNSGDRRASCRFAKESLLQDANDDPFAADLRSVLAMNSFFVGMLSADTLAAYHDIVGNFLGKSDARAGLDALAGATPAAAAAASRAVSLSPQNGAKAVAANAVPARNAPARGIIRGAQMVNIRRSAPEGQIVGLAKEGQEIDLYLARKSGRSQQTWYSLTPNGDRWIVGRFVRIISGGL